MPESSGSGSGRLTTPEPDSPCHMQNRCGMLLRLTLNRAGMISYVGG
jgi:hypothetical protein